MSELFQLILDRSYKKIAIVGMTKNVGKTVTLNYLVQEFEISGLKIGLVSAGYDGERFDRLTLKEKPRIYAPRDSIVATAKACFDAAEAELELIESSIFSTPLGPVCIARVRKAGLVELAGPGSVNSLKELTDRMSLAGADYIIVDGAINRLASASPKLTEATILASGAALGPTMDDVIRKTIFRFALMNLNRVENEKLFRMALKGLDHGNGVLLHREGEDFRIETVEASIPLIAGALLIDRCRQDTEALVFGGALVDNSLVDIMELYDRPPGIILFDATKLFISPETYNKYTNRGGKIEVLKEIDLIAVTVNPTDPCGRGYAPEMFLERMRESLAPCPVFDLVYERS